MSKELIRIDLENRVLKTPGHEYYIADSISMDRLMKFEELQAGVAYGHTFIEIHGKLDQLYEKLQKANFVDAAIILGNLREALHPDVAANKKKHYVLQMCALFMNESSEDVAVWNEATINAKIEDWLSAGVDYRDFFALAVKLVPGLLTELNKTFQTISAMGEAITKAGKNISETEKST